MEAMDCNQRIGKTIQFIGFQSFKTEKSLSFIDWSFAFAIFSYIDSNELIYIILIESVFCFEQNFEREI